MRKYTETNDGVECVLYSALYDGYAYTYTHTHWHINIFAFHFLVGRLISLDKNKLGALICVKCMIKYQMCVSQLSKTQNINKKNSRAQQQYQTEIYIRWHSCNYTQAYLTLYESESEKCVYAHTLAISKCLRMPYLLLLLYPSSLKSRRCDISSDHPNYLP